MGVVTFDSDALIELKVVVTRRGMGERKTANSLRKTENSGL